MAIDLAQYKCLRKSFWTAKRVAQLVNWVILVLFTMYTLVALALQAFGVMDPNNYLAVLHTYGLIFFCFSHSLCVYGALASIGFFVVTVVGSALFEFLGVATGAPFAEYSYNSDLYGVMLVDVPVEVPFSWYFVLYISFHVGVMLSHALFKPEHDPDSYQFGHRQDDFRKPYGQIFVESLFGAAVATCWDQLMQGVGSATGALWTYNESAGSMGGYSDIPFWHYVGMVVAAFLVLFLYQLLDRLVFDAQGIVSPYSRHLALSPLVVLLLVVTVYSSAAQPVILRTTAFVTLGLPLLMCAVFSNSFIKERRRVESLRRSEYDRLETDDL